MNDTTHYKGLKLCLTPNGTSWKTICDVDDCYSPHKDGVVKDGPYTFCAKHYAMLQQPIEAIEHPEFIATESGTVVAPDGVSRIDVGAGAIFRYTPQPPVKHRSRVTMCRPATKEGY